MQGANITNCLTLEGSQTVIAQLGEVDQRVRAIMGGLRGLGDGVTKGLGGISEGTTRLNGFAAALRLPITLLDEVARGQRGAMASTLGTTVERMGEGLPGLVLGLAALGGAFFALSLKSAEATHSLEDQSAALGMDVNQFQALRLVAGEAGVAQERLVVLLGRFSAATGQAQARAQEFGIAQRHAADVAINAQEEMAIAADQARLADERFADAQRQSVFSIQAADDAAGKAGRTLDQLEAAYRAAPAGPRADAIQQQIADASDAAAQAQERADEARRRQDEADEEHDIQVRQRALQRRKSEEQAQQAEDQAAAKRNQIQERADAMLNQAQSGGTDTATRLAAFADLWQKIGSQEERAAIGQAAFGRGWVEMAPLLEKGGQGLIAAMTVAKEYTIPLLEPEKKMAAAFVEGFARMKTIIGDTARVIGDTLSQMFLPAMNATADFFRDNQDTIKAWAQLLVDAAHGVGAVFGAVFDAIPPKIRGFAIALGVAAVAGGGILKAFELLGGALRFLAWEPLVRGFGLLTSAWRILAGIFTFDATFGAIAAMSKGIATLTGWIKAAREAMIAFDIASALNSWTLAVVALGVGFFALGLGIAAATGKLKDFKKDADDAFESVTKYVDKLFSGSKAAEAAASQGGAGLFGGAGSSDTTLGGPSSVMSDSSGGDSSGPQPVAANDQNWPGHTLGGIIGVARAFARGTVLGGYGGGDKIPAALEAGEAVTRKEAVAHYGHGLFHALNNMTANIRGFSLGGIAGGFNDWSASLMPEPVLSFAAGGIVPAISGGGGRAAVHIHIGNEHFAAETDEATAGRLERASSRSQVRSAGRMPSWFTPVG